MISIMNELVIGYVYKLACSETPKTYYGSSFNPKERLKSHLSNQNRCMSRSLINPTMTIVEEIECYQYNKRPLLLAERRYIESNNCVNKKVPLRTQLELYNIKKQDPNYFKNLYIQRGGIEYNKKTMRQCECGGHTVQRNMKRHIASIKHQNYISSNSNQNE